jgi:hypothetical protein
VPSDPPLQLTLVVDDTAATGLALSFTVTPAVDTQPLPSVTITLYVPESKDVAIELLPPFGDQWYK